MLPQKLLKNGVERSPRGADDMLRRLLGLKNKVNEARAINEGSIERLDEERAERKELDARLQAMEYELDVISKGSAKRYRDQTA